jgi:signal peptidase I
MPSSTSSSRSGRLNNTWWKRGPAGGAPFRRAYPLESMYRLSVLRRRALVRWVVNTAGTILLLCVLALVALTQYDIGPIRAVVVRSASMAPTLRPGDLALVNVTEAATESVIVDDIILFHDPQGRPIIHRVIATSNKGLMTKGDANEEPDPFFVEEVEGVQVGRVPWIGYGLQYLQDGFRVIARALS